MVVWDPEGTRTISADPVCQGRLQCLRRPHRARHPSTTLAAGNVVFHRGVLMAVEGAGRYINRPAFKATSARKEYDEN
jgi:dihydropyrimidinase